jgi:flagellar biogenesis protein FliO
MMPRAPMKRFLWLPVVLGLVAAVLFLCAPRGNSQTAATPQPATPLGAPSNLTGLTLRMGLALGVIVVLIVGTVHVLRLVSGRSGMQPGGTLQVLDRCHLGPKRALYSIRAGDRVVVIGVTDTHISAVLELSPAERTALYPDDRMRHGEVPSFRNILRSVTGKGSGA